MTGAHIVCESLIREGVELIFGAIGDSSGPFFSTLHEYPQIRCFMLQHGQDAAHAADGYARATGKVGVCIADSSSEATNMVTGIACAFLDSSPVVVITSQVPISSLGTDNYQEVDITGITMPITKHNYLVLDVNSLATAVKEAFYLARTGRSGPVLVDVPLDIQTEAAKFNYPNKMTLSDNNPKLQGHPLMIRKAAKLIDKARKPVIIAGQGVIISGACRELKKLTEVGQIPITTTLLGIGSFPESHFLSLGMLGAHGVACANIAVDKADLIIAVGMRFHERATGEAKLFARGARIIHIDIDPAEINKIIHADVPIVGDAKQVLNELNKLITPNTHTDWLRQVNVWRKKHPSFDTESTKELRPQYIVRQLHEISGGKATIVTGVGQHQMWAAQHYLYDEPTTLITSGGLGAMGFSLPAAIGVKMGAPSRIVWSLDGDGCFQMTIRELATLAREKLDLKMALINNSRLGMVRQLQEFFCDKRYVATSLPGPDFMIIAEAYGISSVRVEQRTEVSPAIKTAMEYKGPFLIEFIINPEESVYPSVLPGKSLGQFIEKPETSTT